tara:strand:- start:1494 stop:1736 length:243 start_codon:yes stop_codon:yes gene_type:complete
MIKEKIILTFDDKVLEEGFLEFFTTSLLARGGKEAVQFTHKSGEVEEVIFNLKDLQITKINNITRVHVGSTRVDKVKDSG